jgi:hypothetical protein
MNVEQILTNVRNLSLIGNTSAVNDSIKLLAYLNMAYRMEYDAMTRLYSGLVQSTQTITITAGAGTLPSIPHFIASVYDVSASPRQLTGVDIEWLEARDPALDESGPAKYWYLDGFSTIRTYPLNNTTIRVRSVPAAGTLTNASAETDIKLPANFHDVLTWGTAMLVAYDERDKLAASEFQFIGAQLETERDRLQTYLKQRVPRDRLRVEPVTFNVY